LATSGRPGPVWVDIPGDIQLAQMPENPAQFYPPLTGEAIPDYRPVKAILEQAERPLILAGYGIRQSGTVDQFVKFIDKYTIPYVSTYGARDYTANDHTLSIGTVGQRGSRAGNFALQNADVLLILGSSLNASVVGYDPTQFSPASKKIAVDIERDELNKNIVQLDLKYYDNLENFFRAMLV